MGKRVIIIIAAILIIGVIAFGLTRNKNEASTNQANNPAPAGRTAQDNQNQNGGQSPASTDSVTIQNFAFLPGDITVKKGTTVTWTNKDSTTHTVSEMDGKQGPNSGDLSSGDKYVFTFNDVGSFKYRCNIHPDMLGTVTVTD
jgi:plastocyanin